MNPPDAQTASATELDTYFNAAQTNAWLTDVFQKCGMPTDAASRLAHGVVDPAVRGIDSHGLIRIPQYVENLVSGAVNPTANMSWVIEAGAIAVLDADRGSGHVAMSIAMERAIQMAHDAGIGAVSVRNSSHFGAAATYASMASAHHCIGMVFTNGSPVMVPYGGRQAKLSNNPIAISAPGGDKPDVVSDFAMSMGAGGKIRLARMKGEQIPEGWALDKDGNPTTDPAAATGGLLLPIAGHKGYAFAFMSEILAGVLSGSAMASAVIRQGVASIGQVVEDRPKSGPGRGHFCIAINVEAFMPIDEFGSRIGSLIDEMHSTPTLAGFDRVLVPGELETETSARRLADGIPVPSSVFAAIDHAVLTATGHGVPPSVLR